MSYQFIIISATEERKQKMEQQFAALELKSQIYKHYLEGIYDFKFYRIFKRIFS